MKRLHEYAIAAFALAAVAGSLGCSEDMDLSSEVKTMRVLGVRTSSSYAAPGETRDLEMLYHDGAPNAIQADGTHRPVQIVWMDACVNPLGDMYYLCYPSLHAVADQISDEDLRAEQVPDGVPMGFGTDFQTTIPTDIISSRVQDPSIVNPYGLKYAFFAVCGGELRKVSDADRTEDFPLGCFDPDTGQRLGTDDFLYGYYPIYAFESLQNRNPEITGIALGPGASGTPCSDADPCPESEVCSQAGYCISRVPHCTEDDEEDCPEIFVKPLVDETSIERAVMALVSEEDAPLENTWVVYHSSAGTWATDSRMIHDPDVGLQLDYEGYWQAPKSGNQEVRLWAIVRDNRGGVSWIWRDVWVD